MQIFKCQSCAQLVHFENRSCERCGHRLGYVADEFNMSAVEPADGDTWIALAAPARRFRFCANASRDACNWLLPAETDGRYCQACRHNRTVPDLSDPQKLEAWRKMEVAKHRLIYSLMKLKLPLPNRNDDAARGLVFDFLADSPVKSAPPVMTGHDEGLITLALTEADDAERERRRTLMHEPYRTLLGHFRHEVGHYYWDRLVKERGMLAECRAVFGDDEADYEAALQVHYKNGPAPDWQEQFVSAYATTHAWEDFAETWSHYMHIIDCLETARAFGLEVHPGLTRDPALHVSVKHDPYGNGDFAEMVDEWLPMTIAMNSMNRSMGLADLYPFILSAPVVKKLAFIHTLVHRQADTVQQAA